MQFINLLFLLGALALSIPVVIHLLKNKKVKKLWLGSLRFLQEAKKSKRRNRNLKELILLALRLLALAALVIVFLRPYIGSNQDYDVSESSTILLFDVSASMGGTYNEKSMFKEALEKAEDVLQKLEGKTNVSIAAFADDVIELESLKDIKLTTGAGTDYMKAINWAKDRLLAAPKRNMEIVMFSDLQASGLPQTSIESLPEYINFYVYPVLAAGDKNVGVRLEESPNAFIGKTCSINPEVLTSGNASPQGLAEIYVDKHLVQEGSLEKGLKWKPEKVGWHEAEIRIKNEDAWAFDNSYRFKMFAGDAKSVLIVNGRKGKSRFTDASYFVEKAFSVSASSSQTDLNLQLSNEYRAGKENLVVFCDFPRFSDKGKEEFERYIENGGNAIFFLGDETNIEQMNALSQKGVFPARLSRLSAPFTRPIGNWDREHKALSLFKSLEYGSLTSLVFNETFNLKPNDNAKVLASLNDENPVITEVSYGKGKVVVVAGSATRNHSDWVVSRMFLPLIRELGLYLTGESERMQKAKTAVSSIWDVYSDRTDSLSQAVVNFNLEESQVACVSKEEFLNALRIHPINENIVVNKNKKISQSKKRMHNKEWFHWAVLALVFLLIVEGFISYLIK